MASITNPEEQGFAAMAKELRELNFLNVWFNWFFKLLAILSEPFMLIATIYIVIESGIPAFANPTVHFLAIAVMLSAPEIILPGAFVKARDAARDGERMARVLYIICWLFVLLTSLTVINLTVWHFSGLPLNCLNCTRCLVAIGYSILMRVMLHGGKSGLQVAVPDVLGTISELSVSVNEQTANTKLLMSEHETRLSEHLERTIAESEKRVSERFYRTLIEFSQSLNERIDRTSSELSVVLNEQLERTAGELSERIDRTPNELLALPEISELAALPDVFERQLRITVTELKSSLKTNTETNKIVSSRLTSPKLPAVRTNTETNKGDFVRMCLSEHPEMRNSDIQRTASEQGIILSSGYISDIRKAYAGDTFTDTAPRPVV